MSILCRRDDSLQFEVNSMTLFAILQIWGYLAILSQNVNLERRNFTLFQQSNKKNN